VAQSVHVYKFRIKSEVGVDWNFQDFYDRAFADAAEFFDIIDSDEISISMDIQRPVMTFGQYNPTVADVIATYIYDDEEDDEYLKIAEEEPPLIGGRQIFPGMFRGGIEF
jgi:hypothetical protein